jgi:hypothetical protein
MPHPFSSLLKKRRRSVVKRHLPAVRERMKNEINNNPELSARQAYDNVVQQIAREDRGNHE